MAAREALLRQPTLIPGNIAPAVPDLHARTASDSANFDEVLELLHLAGRSLPHAVLMMIPEAWENDPAHGPGAAGLLPLPRQPDGAVGRPGQRRVHRRHASSARCSTATACARAAGGTPATAWSCWPARPACSTSTRPTVVAKGRLQPGRMFLVDTAAGRIVARRRDQGRAGRRRSRTTDWLHAGLMHLDDLPAARARRLHPRLGAAPPADLRLHRGGAEDPARADGADRRRAARLDGHRHPDLAAVDPAAAALRLLHTSSSRRSPTRRWTRSGRSWSPACRPPSARRATCSTRARRAAGRSCCRTRSSTTTSWPRSSPSTRTATCPASRRSGSPGCTRCATAATGIKARLVEICRHVSEAIEDGVRILVLSDRDSTADLAPIPSLLLTAAVHQHLVREQTRTQVALVVESGDCREVHHVGRADRLRRGRGQPVPGVRERSRT